MREPSSAADRIRWAVKQSDRTLVQIADEVGCTHVTLSLWQTGATLVENIKVGLLVKFCEVTGANLQWLLTGEGPRLAHYPKASAGSALVATAEHLARDAPPEVVKTAERVLRALDPDAPA